MEVKIEKAEKSEKSEKPEKAEKAEKGPRFVDVSYKINCISHIDSVTSTYYIDVKLFFHWIDPKFIGRKKNESVDIKTEGAWNPDIVVTNEHQLTSVDQHRDIKVNNSATGELKSSNQYRGTLFINNMDLATFPVDCQNLQICLKPYKLETEKLILRPRREESAIEQQDSHEWNTQPDHRWGVQFMHKKREKKSNFLHFDGKKAEEMSVSSRRTPRAGDARASKSYQYSSLGQDSQGYQAMD
eukprot:gene24128-27298_t